eukprot:Gb_41241 [translate_table: standard]
MALAMGFTLLCPCNASNLHVNNAIPRARSNLISTKHNRKLCICSAVQEKDSKESSNSVEEVTKNWGLEAGLWKIFTSKDDDIGEGAKDKKKNQAKELLARYGGAYLATSISLSLVSFALCYLLISSGVDVQDLLEKVGIHTDETGEKVGTFALAYAAHKAASPIRFPPTVALTPIVAGWIGKGARREEEKENQSN